MEEGCAHQQRHKLNVLGRVKVLYGKPRQRIQLHPSILDAIAITLKLHDQLAKEVQSLRADGVACELVEDLAMHLRRLLVRPGLDVSTCLHLPNQLQGGQGHPRIDVVNHAHDPLREAIHEVLESALLVNPRVEDCEDAFHGAQANSAVLVVQQPPNVPRVRVGEELAGQLDDPLLYCADAVEADLAIHVPKPGREALLHDEVDNLVLHRSLVRYLLKLLLQRCDLSALKVLGPCGVQLPLQIRGTLLSCGHVHHDRSTNLQNRDGRHEANVENRRLRCGNEHVQDQLDDGQLFVLRVPHGDQSELVPEEGEVSHLSRPLLLLLRGHQGWAFWRVVLQVKDQVGDALFFQVVKSTVA
eukprot:scaffold2117_cov241-Pinguiococcus_pyrenoidosus.AAC.1